MRPSVWLVLAITVLMLGETVWWISRFAQPRPQKPTSRSVVIKKTPARVRDDLDRLSYDGWRELLESFHDERDERGTSRVDQIVRPGQTILADVYEGETGEIVYSTLTPFIKELDDGRRVIQIKIDVQGVTFQGGTRQLFSQFSKIRTLQDGSAESDVEFTRNGQYNLGLSAELTGQDGNIHLQSTGSYEKHLLPMSPETAKAMGL